MSLKIGALFAGYGGLDLAVESVLDSRVSWVAEFDDGPSRILAHRYPHAPNLRDVTTVDWSAVEPVDIITGGSPCQDLSHAGKRAGMKDGTRSGLWAAMCDAVETIRPRLVIWENVRGALSAEAAAGDVESCEFCVGDPGEPPLRALGRVLGDLAELGYDAGWVGLRAADVGAPHGRWRVFVVAWPADPADASSPRLWEHAGEPPAEEARQGGCDLAPGARGLRAARDGRQAPVVWGSPEWRALSLLPTPTATDHKASGSAGCAKTGTHSTGTTLADATVRQPERFGAYVPAIARWEAVLGRPAPDPTEPTGKDGAHRLSPRFVEFMMGLPDGWVTDPAIWEGVKPSTARNAQLKALGNGVVPQQAAAAIRHILTLRDAS